MYDLRGREGQGGGYLLSIGCHPWDLNTTVKYDNSFNLICHRPLTKTVMASRLFGTRSGQASGQSRELQNAVSKCFLEYLESEGRKETTTISQLREIFERQFQTEYETHGVRFPRVLNTLSYHMNECQHVRGKVVFGCGEEAALQILDSDSDSDSDESFLYPHYCEVCKRNFGSQGAYQFHLGTVRHRQQRILGTIKTTLER